MIILLDYLGLDIKLPTHCSYFGEHLVLTEEKSISSLNSNF